MKGSNQTVLTKVIQYVCIGLIAVINYFLLGLLLAIFFGDRTFTYVLTGII